MDEEIREFIKQEMSYGAIDYNQRIEDVAEAFGLSLDEAEGYVWDYTIDPTTWAYEGCHYVLEDSHGDILDGYDDEQEAIEAAKNDPDCVRVSCYSDDTEDAEFIETTWTRESEESDEPLKEEVLTEAVKSNGVNS